MTPADQDTTKDMHRKRRWPVVTEDGAVTGSGSYALVTVVALMGANAQCAASSIARLSVGTELAIWVAHTSFASHHAAGSV